MSDLGPGGQGLWDAYTDLSLNADQSVILLEACRAKDRLDKLDELLCGDIETWARLTHRLQTQDYELKIDAALPQANSTATNLRQLLALLPPIADKPKAKNGLDEIAARRASRQAEAESADAPAVGKRSGRPGSD